MKGEFMKKALGSIQATLVYIGIFSFILWFICGWEHYFGFVYQLSVLFLIIGIIAAFLPVAIDPLWGHLPDCTCNGCKNKAKEVENG